MNRERTYYLKVCLVCYLAWFILFEMVGQYAAGLPTMDLTTPLDRSIPLAPQFVWVYELCYLIPFLPLLLVEDWHRFNRALVAIALASLSAFLVYLAFPIAFPRPELGTSLADRVLRLEYNLDFKPGANKLPSLHVTIAWIVYFTCRKQRLGRFGDQLLLLTVVLITVSTLFVKQHIVVDVVAGIGWAVIAWLTAALLYARIGETSSGSIDALRSIGTRSGSVLLAFSVIALAIAAIKGVLGSW